MEHLSRDLLNALPASLGPFADNTPEGAWCKGRAAGTAGRPFDANPHPTGTELALDWTGGWREGAKLRNRRQEPPKPPRR